MWFSDYSAKNMFLIAIFNFSYITLLVILVTYYQLMSKLASFETYYYWLF